MAKVLDGIDTYYSGANAECSVWTRTDNESSFTVVVEETLLDVSFWQALERVLEVDGVYPYGDWKHLWYAFIGHVSNGGTFEDFFENIPAPSMDKVKV